MKKLLLLWLCCVLSLFLHAQTNYYWYKSNKIYLHQDASTFFVYMNDAKAHARATSKSDIMTALNLNDSAVSPLSKGYIIKAGRSITPAMLADRKLSVKYQTPLLRNEANTPIVVLPRLIVELKGTHRIDEVLALYPQLSVLTDKGFNTYVLDANVATADELFKIVNELYENHSSLVNWSEPDFYAGIKPMTNDPYYQRQYWLKNIGQSNGIAGVDINVDPAWNLTKGSSALRVAIIDEGIEAHEEFTGRILSGYTAGAGGGTGAPQNGDKRHGVNVAGILTAAADNSKGIAGVAPRIQILPVNIYPNAVSSTNPFGAATVDEIAAAIDWSWNQGAADVLNCSWGSSPQSSNLAAAINRARTLGRKGKGCPVVFGAGNSGTAITFPANLDGVITVGACTNFATWPSTGSDIGASLDVVAPVNDGNLTTTARMGTGDDPTKNYTFGFGGTSSACPQGAGTAALMLSVNPNLTEAQIRSIIQTTATDMGPTGFDNKFGYGRLNAGAAVTRAFQTAAYDIGGSDILCGPGNYNIPNLPADATVKWELVTPGVVTINTPNAIQTIVTPVDYGFITLKATVSFGGNTTFSLTKSITVGMPYLITSVSFLSDGFGVSGRLCNNASGSDNYANTFAAQINTPIFNNQSVSLDYLIFEAETGELVDQGHIDNFQPFTHYRLPNYLPTGLYGFDARLTSNCGVSEYYEIAMEYSPCNASEFKALTIDAYPNPVTSDLYVTINETDTHVQKKTTEKTATVKFTLFDVNKATAVKQWTDTDDKQQYQLNVAGVKAGHYILLVTKGTNRQTKHIIIN